MLSLLNKMITIGYLRTALIFMLAAAWQASADNIPETLSLVKNGSPMATIILAEKPGKAAAFAVWELNSHIRKITGIQLPVKSPSAAAKLKGLKICVGESAVTRRLGFKNQDFQDQEYIILAKSGYLLLMGRDSSTVAPRKDPPALPEHFDPRRFDQIGTCYAVYDFLEKFCGVRWFGPGEVGLCHPVGKNLEVNCGKVNIRRKPVFYYRYSYPLLPSNKRFYKLFGTPSAKDMKLFALRLRAGGERYSCTHSFYSYYDRFLNENPKNKDKFEGKHLEYFAKGYSGRPPQLCYSSDAVIEQVVKDIKDQLDGKSRHLRGSGDYVALEPMDSGRFCKCPKCLEQIKKVDKDNPTRASEYWFGFVNKVAKKIKKTHPDKFISTLAYWNHLAYPETMQLESNITVQMCLATRLWQIPWQKNKNMKYYRQWLQKSGKDRRLFLWLYYCYPGWNGVNGGFNYFPGYFAHSLDKQIKTFAKDKIRGVFLEIDHEFDLDSYLTFKLLDNPQQNIDVLLSDFFEKYYGAAAVPMKKIYLIIEDRYNNIKNYPEDLQAGAKYTGQTEEIAWKYLGTENVMKKLAALMAKAEKLAATPMEKKRVELFKNAVFKKMTTGLERYLCKAKYKDEVDKIKNSPPPTIMVSKLSKDANGKLEDVDFSQATDFGLWYTTYGYSPDRKISGKITYDDGFLYLLLCDHTAPAKLLSSNGIWGGDDWEIFLSSSREAAVYKQVGVNPAGELLVLQDNAILRNGIKVSSDTDVSDRWTVKLAIPLKEIIKGGVKPGSEFYMNIVRGTKSGGDNLCWSALFNKAFFTPKRLGKVVLEP